MNVTEQMYDFLGQAVDYCDPYTMTWREFLDECLADREEFARLYNSKLELFAHGLCFLEPDIYEIDKYPSELATINRDLMNETMVKVLNFINQERYA